MTYDYVVVGAGLTGATAAYCLLEKGYNVLITDLRDHVGGTSADKINNNGLLAPLFGPHAFHTNSDRVWKFLSQFTEWVEYTQRSLTRYDGNLYEIPVNASTIERFFGVTFRNEREAQAFLSKKQLKIKQVATGEDLAMTTLGPQLYKAFYDGYTRKQWNCSAAELHRSVIGRIPVRVNRDDRYFSDMYQALPRHGYTAMVEKMLSDIELSLSTRMTLQEALQEGEKVIWTGPIDEAFDNKFGPLEWRSLYWKEVETDDSNPASVVHEANFEVPWTRCTDVGYFSSAIGLDRGCNKKTTLLFEYSSEQGEKFYPILRPDMPQWAEEHNKIHKYKMLANNHSRAMFLGRMGRHKYLNMDQAVSDALTFMDSILEK